MHDSRCVCESCYPSPASETMDPQESLTMTRAEYQEALDRAYDRGLKRGQELRRQSKGPRKLDSAKALGGR